MVSSFTESIICFSKSDLIANPVPSALLNLPRIIPITFPFSSINGPPLFPGFTGIEI